MSSADPASTLPPSLSDITDTPITDPPPPYPSRERRHKPSRLHRAQHSRIHASQHSQTASGDSNSQDDAQQTPSYADEDEEPSETTPFLTPSSRRAAPGAGRGRPRAYSYTSSTSTAPSLAQTVLSLFQTEDEPYFVEDGYDAPPPLLLGEDVGRVAGQRHRRGLLSLATWRRYFRPLTVKAYYKSFFHLAVLNFPYAVAAWVYLFVFTVTGTTLLIALPLGAVLCFFDLLGARAFSRGELALQTRFHGPLAHPPPYPPRPIFTRYRESTTEEAESGQIPDSSRHSLVRERSFYKNTYAMFTDPTSYQALFYFLVIKPAITLLVSLGIVAIALPCIALVLPAPAILRAVRKIGLWQANVAVEGLYLAVR